MINNNRAASANGLDHNPYLFVVGCPRSGTTLLQRMLDSHPQLAVANDTHFITHAIPGLEPGGDPALTPAIVESVRTNGHFDRFGLSDDAVRDAATGAVTYSEYISGLYTQLGCLHGKPLAGQKTPRYGLYLPFLHALFPQAKTVNIIRDGRDVTLSTLEWAHEKKGPGRFALWKDHPVAVCAQWWAWQVSTGQRDGRALGPTLYHEVHYEDLVARPEESLRRIADFLDLPYAPEMLTFYEGKMRDEPRLSSKKKVATADAGAEGLAKGHGAARR